MTDPEDLKFRFETEELSDGSFVLALWCCIDVVDGVTPLTPPRYAALHAVWPSMLPRTVGALNAVPCGGQ